MSGSTKSHPTTTEDGQPVELHPPVDDDGWYASQVRDWVSVSPELSDSAIRLYLIMRALVIDKRGPVRKLTLWELCHLLPAKPVPAGERPAPSSVSRIRGLLRQLTLIGLVTTPEGHRLTTSSRALAAGRGLRIRINLMPHKGYQGPRNVFDALDDVRGEAEQSAQRARARELKLAAEKREQKAAEAAGQISDPPAPGQISDPLGQISDPLGQISDPHSGGDLQDRGLPLSPPAQSSRSDVPPASVRPSVQVDNAHGGRMDGRGGGIDRDQEHKPEQPGRGSAAADAAPEDKAAARAGGAPLDGSVQAVDASPGVALITTWAGESPALSAALVQGSFLRDQGLAVTGLLEMGWKAALVRQVLLTPMPATVERTESAVIAGRLRKLAGMPVPPDTAPAGPAVPPQASAPAFDRDGQGGASHWGTATPTPPSWAKLQEQQDQLRRGADHVRGCEGDDQLCPTLAVVGETMCAEHLGWPECPGVTGPCGRRTRDGQQCPTCQDQAFHIRLAEALPVPATDDGTCPGHSGPCGRNIAVGGGGLCRRCRVASQQDRDRLEQEWRASVAEAVATAEAADALEGAPAPL
ncbi:hypothetical protein ACIOFQ_33110 [[Kitasatospora] papulosa]|uniref:hypothetical protein n=1 Tax=[Kitasatospora] papulosa TaxID=1464011 RepID=UPI00382832FE